MKTLIALLTSLLLCQIALAQTQLFPVRVDRKWGFVDTKGNLVVRPKYDAVGEFGKNSYTRFSLNGKLGLVQTNGTELFLEDGQDAEILDDSTVAVKVDTLWGIKHISGSEILPIIYERIAKKEQGNLWVTKGGLKGLFNYKGEGIVPCRFINIALIDSNLLKATTHDSDYFYSGKGKLLFKGYSNQFDPSYWPVIIDQNRATSWQICHTVSQKRFEGFTRFVAMDSIHFQLFSTDSSWIFNASSGQFFSVDINDGIEPYLLGYFQFTRFGKKGIITSRGSELIPAAYDQINFQNNVFIVWQGQRQGVIDGRGNKVLPPIYEFISFHNSGLMILQNNGLLGCAKPSGQLLLKPSFSQFEYSDRQLRGYRNKALVFIDFDKQWNIKDQYEFKKVKTVRLDFDEGINPISRLDLATVNVATAPPKGWFQSTYNRLWGFRRPDSSLRHVPQFTQVGHYPQSGLTAVIKLKEEMGFGKVLDDTYVQSSFMGLALTKDANYLVMPKYWYIFPQELRRADVGYARMLTFTGKQQVFSYKKGVRVKKDYEYIDTLVENRARFAIGGHISLDDNPKSPINLCTQLEFKQYIGIDTLLIRFAARPAYRKQYVKFEYAKWGYLSEEGKEIIPAKFDFVSPFHHGTAIVQLKKKWGVIDINGEFIVKPQYFRIQRIEYENRSYFQVFKPEPRFGLVDSLGEIKVYPEYHRATVYENGFLPVKLPGGWTFIDSNRIAICAPEYDRVAAFESGMAAVQKKGRWGFVNTNGDLKVATKYQRVLSYEGNRTWVQYRGKWALIDRNGLQISSKPFKNPKPFQNGTTWVQKDKSNRCGLVDTNGEYLIKPRFNNPELYLSDSLTVVSRKNKKALVNSAGDVLTPFIFLSIDSFSNGWAHASTVDGAVLLHRSGRHKPLKKEYYEKSTFHQGLSRVKQNGLFGYIDTNGNEVVPCIYKKARRFSEGLAFCKEQRKKTQCINSAGETVFTTLGWVIHNFNDQRAVIQSAGRQFYVNTEGRLLFGNTYREAAPFSQGLARVRNEKKWVLINDLGQPLMTPKFVQIKDFSGPYSVVKRSGSHGLFNNDGKVVLDVIYDELKLLDNRYYFLSVYDKVGHFDLANGWIWEPKR